MAAFRIGMFIQPLIFLTCGENAGDQDATCLKPQPLANIAKKSTNKIMNAQLNSIAKRYNLWERAQSSALECLENYISGTLTVDFPSLQHVNQKDFSLTRRDQRIIHPENGNTMNIFRTTFDIKLEKHNQVICGFYSFDVNEEGDAVDDWLILNDSNVG